MNDDELGAFLRSEIPDAGVGYWDAIDARIEAAAAVEVPKVTPTEPVQTEAEVVRLTGMQTTTESLRNRRTPLLAAMAAAIVLIGGLAFVVNRGDDSTTTIDPAIDGSAPDDTTPPITAPTTTVPTTTAPDSVAPEPATPTTVPTPLPGVGQETLPTVEPFTVVALDGAPTALNETPGFGGDGDEVSDPDEVLMATGVRVLIDHREWLQVTRTAGFTGWVEAIDVQLTGDEDTREGSEPLPSTAPAQLEVGRGGELEVLDQPGFVGNQIGSAEIGVTVDFTGERSLASGFEWFEVVVDGVTGWVMANTVQPIGTIASSRECYSDGDAVLFLDFTDDAATFTGALAYLDGVEAVAGVRGGTGFFVATSPIGSGEEPDGPIVNQEAWQAFAEGMSVGERAFLDFVECPTVQTEVDQLDRLVGGSYPAFPLPD
ncbi:MAG: hypothetical protein AAGC53_00280 [Actinomycetota bacterium]